MKTQNSSIKNSKTVPQFSVAQESKKASKAAQKIVLLSSKGLEKKSADFGSLPAALQEEIQTEGAPLFGLFKKGDLGAKFLAHTHEGKILFFGLGNLDKFTEQDAAEWGVSIGNTLNQSGSGEWRLSLPEDLRKIEVLENLLKGISLANQSLDELLSKKKSRNQITALQLQGKITSALDDRFFSRMEALVEGLFLARELVELPSNVASPQGIVDRARATLDGKKLEIEVWDEKKIKAVGMALFLAVAQGSEIPPRFLVMRYRPKGIKNPKRLALVGKGVAFDTGGVNVKTGMGWRELLSMKKDMGGAAAVIGAMHSISQIAPAIEVIGITPLTFNSVDGRSVNPGDVIRSYSGKTVEIGNTDAEGRLILADALHYATLQKVDWIVDAATLTGAICIALGSYHSGLFTNSDPFGAQVLRLSEKAGEPAWWMPMSSRYGEELKCPVADLSNMGTSRDGGAQIGAKFMENFVGDTRWVHLDIAGTVDLSGPAKAGTWVQAAGRMVHTFVLLAEHLAESAHS